MTGRNLRALFAIVAAGCLALSTGAALAAAGTQEPAEVPENPCPVMSHPCGACTSTCTTPSDSSQCSQCCAGRATCLTCCNANYAGREKQKCTGYCEFEFPSSITVD